MQQVAFFSPIISYFFVFLNASFQIREDFCNWLHFSVPGFPRSIFYVQTLSSLKLFYPPDPQTQKRPLPSLHLKVVHTHWSILFNFQLFLIVSFYKSLHYAPYILQTLHNICIISRLKSLQSPINTGFIYPNSSLSGTHWKNFHFAFVIIRDNRFGLLKCFFRYP